MEKQPSIEKNERAQILKKYGASDMRDLHLRIYMDEDQMRMKNLAWDYKDASSLVNRIYLDCKNLDESKLDESDSMWLRETLYFWNHHAVSCALGRYKDYKAAREFVDAALFYQDKDHQPIFWLPPTYRLIVI